MPKIIIDSELLAARGWSINELLSPLIKSTDSEVLCTRKGVGYGAYAIAAYQGNEPINYRDARFLTYLDSFQAQYFEIWTPVDPHKMGEWYLNLAYLNIFNNTQEYVCLHCDPEYNGTDGSTKACYKQSPHIHLRIANQLSRSHIAIAHGFLDKIYKSHIDFFNSMLNGIELINDEILQKYQSLLSK